MRQNLTEAIKAGSFDDMIREVLPDQPRRQSGSIGVFNV